MKRTLNILLIIAALTMTNCECWYDPLIMELPPITEEGKNTFGCMIEDEVYVPQARRLDFSGIPIGCEVWKFPETESLFSVETNRFVGKSDKVKDAKVNIEAKDICGSGTYTMDDGWILYNDTWYQVLPNTSSLTITKLDTIKGIISGQFYFQASRNKEDIDSKIITISNGRFDLNWFDLPKYRTLQ